MDIMKNFLKVSTKSQYALRLLTYIASSEGRVVSLAEVSEKEGISYGYLEEIVAPLKKCGILASKAGRSGGYFLLKTPEKINISDVVNIFEGETAPVKCLAGSKCSKEKGCKTRVVWSKLKQSVDDTLESIKLSDIL